MLKFVLKFSKDNKYFLFLAQHHVLQELSYHANETASGGDITLKIESSQSSCYSAIDILFPFPLFTLLSLVLVLVWYVAGATFGYRRDGRGVRAAQERLCRGGKYAD